MTEMNAIQRKRVADVKKNTPLLCKFMCYPACRKLRFSSSSERTKHYKDTHGEKS